MRLNACVVLAVVGLASSARATPLSELAVGLAPGSWAELPTQGFDSALLEDRKSNV